MKKSILKVTLVLCAMFTFGSVNLQDSMETKHADKSIPAFSCNLAEIIPPIIPTGGPHKVLLSMEASPNANNETES